MRVRLRPSLVNKKDQDPGLFIDLEGARDAFLVDCGSLDSISKADLLRVSHICVTHTHIDHFCGFDRLLRNVLSSPETITVFGPPGITDNVRGKLDGYTWNLVDDSGPTFRVKELLESHARVTELACKESFIQKRASWSEPLASGRILADDRVVIRYAALEHKIPSLAYSIEEVPFASIRARRIGELGLREGPWLSRLQKKALEGFSPGEELEVSGSLHKVQWLMDELVDVKPGHKVCYVTDTIFNERTLAKVVALVSGADEFFCESNYQDVDVEKAAQNYHLTARQAAIFAREAGVARLILFHVSRKYMGDIRTSLAEARQEFDPVE